VPAAEHACCVRGRVIPNTPAPPGLGVGADIGVMDEVELAAIDGYRTAALI
jgi:hypothetical protein